MAADMGTEIDAARLLAHKAALLKDRGVRHSLESAMAKLYASEMASRVANKALQIHGGQGYSKEFDVERHVGDARITEIYEGTSEIQRRVISANLPQGSSMTRFQIAAAQRPSIHPGAHRAAA